MMNLIRGDKNNLLGRVIAFSTCDNPMAIEATGSKPIIAFYSTTDIDSFIKRIGATENLARDLKRTDKQMKDDVRKKGNLKILQNYVSPLNIEDENQLRAGDEDLLFTGEYNSLENCCYAAELGTKFYILNVEEAFAKKVKLPKNKLLIERKPLLENWGLLEKETIKSYIKHNFIAPALASYQKKDSVRAKGIINDLTEFCVGAPFSDDIAALVGIIRENKSSNYGLIENYLNKIQAIAQEDYLSAAKFRDQILKQTRNRL